MKNLNALVFYSYIKGCNLFVRTDEYMLKCDAYFVSFIIYVLLLLTRKINCFDFIFDLWSCSVLLHHFMGRFSIDWCVFTFWIRLTKLGMKFSSFDGMCACARQIFGFWYRLIVNRCTNLYIWHVAHTHTSAHIHTELAYILTPHVFYHLLSVQLAKQFKNMNS